MTPATLSACAAWMQEGKPLLEQRLHLDIAGFHLTIRSNSDLLLTTLRNYFPPLLHTTAEDGVEVDLIERETLPSPYPLQPWQREAGKRLKDRYFDLPGGRLIEKSPSSILFLQSHPLRIAAGETERYPNKVINFINIQQMNHLLQQGALLFHAAAVAYNHHAYAIAGFSGGGKSTLMLHLLDHPELHFLSNDALYLLQREGDTPLEAVGAAKLPRINPGTILHNGKLHPLLTAERLQQLQQLPPLDLWRLEEKYDLPLEEIYGRQRVSFQAEMKGLVILNWQHNSTQPTTIHPVNLQQRRDLLPAVMKSPGPFYQNSEGQFTTTPQGEEDAAYLHQLQQIEVLEVRGKVDFVAARDLLLQKITGE
ncbi:MAG: HprK-related kinase B [Gammaproteobacteria bacterium]|nr:HprK-related kinase B [Gammaproteobacteria bacterium]